MSPEQIILTTLHADPSKATHTHRILSNLARHGYHITPIQPQAKLAETSRIYEPQPRTMGIANL